MGLVIDGGAVMLRMDYAAVLAVEDALGRGIMAVAAELAQGRLGLRDMMEMVALCARPGMEREGLGERLVAGGVAKLAEALAEMLCGVLAGEEARQERGELAGLMERFPD